MMIAGAGLAIATILALTPARPVAPADFADLTWTGHWAFRWTHMYEDGARLVGGGVGLLLDERTRLELVGFGTAKPSRYSTLAFRLAYGGLQVEHELARWGRLALGAAGTVALGTFSVEDRRADTTQRTGVWLAEPEVFFGIHVGEHVRLTAGVGHRWVTGVEGDIPNRSDGDARGPVLALRMTVR